MEGCLLLAECFGDNRNRYLHVRALTMGRTIYAHLGGNFGSNSTQRRSEMYSERGADNQRYETTGYGGNAEPARPPSPVDEAINMLHKRTEAAHAALNLLEERMQDGLRKNEHPTTATNKLSDRAPTPAPACTIDRRILEAEGSVSNLEDRIHFLRHSLCI